MPPLMAVKDLEMVPCSGLLWEVLFQCMFHILRNCEAIIENWEIELMRESKGILINWFWTKVITKL